MKIDKSNLRRVIEEEPTQFREGLAIAKDVSCEGTFDAVVLSGMGGSAMPGYILKIFVDDLYARGEEKKHIAVHNNYFYTLPPQSEKNALNIADSFSGNTEETVASLEEALEKKLPVVGVTSGGTIEEICTKNNVPFAKLPFPYEGFQPRMALGYQFGAVAQILTNCGMIGDHGKEIGALESFLSERVSDLEQKGKALADTFKGKTPVIYASDAFRALAMIFKIKLNENAKTPACWNFFPELNHNEMVGFTNPQADFTFVFLRDPDDDARNLKRYDVLQKLLADRGLSVTICDLEGTTAMEKTFSLFLLADWASYHLALSYGQDPTPVDMVEDFKKML